EQLKCTPTLLIHGDSSNSGVFAPMIHQISKNDPHKPLFTIDLTSYDGVVSVENHLSLIVAKVKEIAALYPTAKCPKISFIGHSSGGDVLGSLVKAMQLGGELPLPGTIIKIGSIFKEHEAQEFIHYAHGKMVEIVGTQDIFVGDKSHLTNKPVVVS